MIEIIRLFGRGFAVADVAWAIWMLYRGWHRRQLDMDYLWFVSLAVSGAVMQWASGFVLWLAYASWFVFAIIFAISMIAQSRTRLKRIQAERLSIIEAIQRNHRELVQAVEQSKEANDDH